MEMNYQAATPAVHYPYNILDYRGTPSDAEDRDPLVFSDQGAWFAYGFPTSPDYYGGFSGPFLMTQDNGVWCSKSLSQLELTLDSTDLTDAPGYNDPLQRSYNSHLEQVFERDYIKVVQKLFFASAHSAFIITEITNISEQTIGIDPGWKGAVFAEGLRFEQEGDGLSVVSDRSEATGHIRVFGNKIRAIEVSDTSYRVSLEKIQIKAGETGQLILTHSFIFPEYSLEMEQKHLSTLAQNPEEFLNSRILEKKIQLNKLYNKMDVVWDSVLYKDLLVKAVLTMQNNWRAPAGELKYSGLFPSYHYEWFNGFWAWDSWKHAAALAHYAPHLAKEQIRAMYHNQMEDGFIPDCIFRDTTIENHNYRNTKPPLSAWATWKVFEQSHDTAFLMELYPKIHSQHNWWYSYRDHDHDGICEYGSTDGSLIAAKWESGMDNAVRFDSCNILRNSAGAFSLDQESVDLNAYLYAEKGYLSTMADVLDKKEEARQLREQAQELKAKIQQQFYDPASGWFYDTSLDGKTFIKAMGCEGWIPLWVEIATKEQGEHVKNNMMNPYYFNTKVPLQTLNAGNSSFKPNRGYWRGPTWLDQSYFGVKGMQSYGYYEAAHQMTYKLMHNAEGVLAQGLSIRENYNPITGEGLESKNFSWSAASYLLLLIAD